MTVVQAIPRYACSTVSTPRQDDRARREQPRDRRRHHARGEQDHHPGEDDERPLRTRPERDRLPADERRLVDDEHVRIVEVVLERAPGALQEQRVADRELRLAGQVLALALDREHDEIAALRHHPREHRLADQRRARRDDHLRHARPPADELVGVVVERVLVDERPREVAEVARDRPCLPVPAAVARRRTRRSRSSRRAAGRRRARTRRSRTGRPRRRPRTRRRSR